MVELEVVVVEVIRISEVITQMGHRWNALRHVAMITYPARNVVELSKRNIDANVKTGFINVLHTAIFMHMPNGVQLMAGLWSKSDDQHLMNILESLILSYISSGFVFGKAFGDCEIWIKWQ